MNPKSTRIFLMKKTANRSGVSLTNFKGHIQKINPLSSEGSPFDE